MNKLEEKSVELMSDLIVYNKYARYRSDLKRRETYSEIIDRYIASMLKKYCGEDVADAFKKSKSINVEKGSLAEQIVLNSKYLYDKKVLPSMRALQFSGPAIEKNESRVYNCYYHPIEGINEISETMFLLLGGTGVGFSVRKHHVEKLPAIKKPTKTKKFLVSDDIEGWADSIKVLMKSYLGVSKYKPRFDFTGIRERGEPLITAGGKAPGPGPLRVCLAKIESLLEVKDEGIQLEPIDVHDIICHIADAVLAGGIRRAALISLFSPDDEKMMTCKAGNWWETNPQRARSNNSFVVRKEDLSEAEFKELIKYIEDSNSGEPGVYFTSDDNNGGTNPCAEIYLRPYQFCNLTEINGGTVEDQKDFNMRAKVASFFGTLQAGFTDFHYLKSRTKKQTEKDYLIGVGITGICNGNVLDLNLTEGAEVVKLQNEITANEIGIGPAARTTTVKPSGTTSSVLGVSSGIHAWHSEYYIRNIQCRVGDDLYKFFVDKHPELIKIMDRDPNSAVIGCPIQAPNSAIIRDDETLLQFLERVKKFNLEWVKPGHRVGDNTNNVSATAYIRDGEWDALADWMWDNKDTYHGISLFPFFGGTYKDAPFQSCTKEEFENRLKLMKEVDITQIVENEDNTDLSANLACAGGGCDLVY